MTPADTNRANHQTETPDMTDEPDFRAALSDANNAIFDALTALQSGDVETAKKLLGLAHARSGEMLIENE